MRLIKQGSSMHASRAALIDGRKNFAKGAATMGLFAVIFCPHVSA
jgi:hypothetical protein